jgi:hypothetical protein
MAQGLRSLGMSLSIALLIVAIADFGLTATILQWVRTDLDPIAIPLSAYLKGNGGIWLRCAYYMMAAALAGLAWASYRATSANLRSGLASSLFGVAAFTLPPVAVTTLYEHSPHEDLARFVHGEAAQTTFLCLVVAMLLLSSRWRRDPRMRHRSLAGQVLASLAFVQMWVLALWKGAPPGLTQKALIVLILLWLSWAAQQLWRAARPE